MDGAREQKGRDGREGGDERASGLLSDRRISRDDDDEDDEDNCDVPSPPRPRALPAESGPFMKCGRDLSAFIAIDRNR